MLLYFFSPSSLTIVCLIQFPSLFILLLSPVRRVASLGGEGEDRSNDLVYSSPILTPVPSFIHFSVYIHSLCWLPRLSHMTPSNFSLICPTVCVFFFRLVYSFFFLSLHFHNTCKVFFCLSLYLFFFLYRHTSVLCSILDIYSKNLFLSFFFPTKKES